jgi:hypothetical protein
VSSGNFPSGVKLFFKNILEQKLAMRLIIPYKAVVAQCIIYFILSYRPIQKGIILGTNALPNGTAHFKNLNNYFNTNIYSYLGTSDDQSSNLYLNIVHFFKTRVN